MRQAVAEAGRGLPAIEPGMPPPGRHRAQPALVPAALGAAMLSVYGASKLRLRRPRGGDRPGGRRQRPGARLDLPRRRRRLALGARADHRPDLPLAAPDAGAARRAPGRRSPRTRACAGTPPRRRSTPCTGRARCRCCPAVGYTSPDQSHFTSRHYWEVGALQPNEITGWMGRLLDAIGTPDNPLQGLSLDGSLSPALATGSLPVAAIDGPVLRPLGRGRLGRAGGADVRRGRRARSRRRRGQGRRACRPRAAPPPRRCS